VKHPLSPRATAQTGRMIVSPQSRAVAEGPLADEVLTGHHRLIRRLFEAIEATPRHDPERRALMRPLASWKFTNRSRTTCSTQPSPRRARMSPSPTPSTGSSPTCSPLLSKLDTASDEFAEHLRALHAAVVNHAGSEERSMFVHARRLGEARLRELGRRLESMLERRRTSRFQSAFRALKVRLIEGT
jgi:hypothetical protein